MILFLKIILAHFIGDFALQSDNWIKDKEKRKIRSASLYRHILIHALLLIVLIHDPAYWLPILIIIVFHYIIDVGKLYLQDAYPSSLWFWIDQLAHILVLAAVAVNYFGLDPNNWFSVNDNQFILILIAIIFVTLVSSRLIRIMISQWSPETEDSDDDSLSNAGHFIGMLERLFVFAFVITANFQAVGFLLAAKSVFRFGDLKESKDRKLTEYILIGTLLSFGLAILSAWIYLYLSDMIESF